MRLLIHSFVRVVSFVCNHLVHMAVIELIVSSTTVAACYILKLSCGYHTLALASTVVAGRLPVAAASDDHSDHEGQAKRPLTV
jgi:hypothetical protein